jgi:Ca-activated chloride channel homolog
MTRPSLSARLVLAAIVAAAPMMPGSSPAQDKTQELQGVGVSVTSVTIAVTVQTKRGKFANDLAAGDFTIFENGVKQAITHFEHDFRAPASLTILLDVSGSMALQDKMKESKEALLKFVGQSLGPEDETALLIFADGEVEVASVYSGDKTALLAVLAKTEAYGKTALNDAVAVSPEFARRGRYAKKALLLITDGIENDSRYSPAEAAETAKKVDVPIYTIGYKIPLDEQLLAKHKRAKGLTGIGIVESLESFSRATGGKAFFIDTREGMDKALQEIKREMGFQYIMGYTSHADAAVKYRRIKVVTRDKKLVVRTREGYEY